MSDATRRDAWVVFVGVALVLVVWVLGVAEVLASGGSVALGWSEPTIDFVPGPWGPAFVEAGLEGWSGISIYGAVLCLPYGGFVARKIPRLRWFGAAVVAAGVLAFVLRGLLFVMAMGAVLG